MSVSRRRIAFVLPVYWPAVGGCELHTRELASRLAQRHDVRVITLITNEEDKHSHELWVAAILRAPRKTSTTWDGTVSVTRVGMGELQRLVYAPLARVQSPKLPDWLVGAAMERLAGHYRQKLEELLSEVDIVHSVHGGVSFLGYAALMAARRLEIPYVYTPLMHWQADPRERNGNAAAPVLSLRLVPRTWTDAYWKRIWQEADALFAMTEYERQHYVREGVPEQRVHRTGVGPMVQLNFAQPSGVSPENEHMAPMILFLGRNTLAKGVPDVLHAAPMIWEEFPCARFVFAGPRMPETDASFAAASDRRIEVLGEVSEAEKNALLRDCAILCVPSREESLGATFLEAWAHGKPIVGLRIPPLVELTNGGRGGLLAEPTPRDIADKLLTLIRNPQLRQNIGESGRQLVRERYSWSTIVERTEAIYEALIEKAPRAGAPSNSGVSL